MKSKRRMQNVSFRTIEDFLDFLPDEELLITEQLRSLVLTMIPDVKERLSYNVPYYRRHADICFIWPGSVAWGSKSQQGVRFGFTQGFLIPDEIGFLDKGNRKLVYWHDFLNARDIDEDLVSMYLAHAVEIDEQHGFEKRSSSH